MDAKTLDRIDDLESIIPPAPSPFGIGLERHDWRPVWQLAKQIQEGFNSGVRYNTKELRQEAWSRFSALRDEASRRAASERESLKSRSEYLRDSILDDCRGIGYSAVIDTVFFFDKTTIDQMKARGKYLAEAMQHLAKHKHEMLGEHKQQVFERFQELKQEHEQFWSKVREGRRQRTREFSSKIRDNLEKNHETLRKSTSALERFRAKADDLRDKISNSNSEKWTGIWSEWLAEAETKIDDIEAQINRIQGWIEEDEKKLGGNRW